MRVKSGETVTLEVNAELQYTCSKCGYRNTAYDVIRIVRSTPTILGFNVDESYREKAQEEMNQIIAKLSSNDLAHKYTKARFSCKCEKCRYREPWARMSFKIFDGFDAIVRGLLAVCIVFFFLSLISGDPFMPLLYCGILCVAVSVIISVLKKWHIMHMEQRIPTLPADALPIIRLIHKSQAPSNMYGYKVTPVAQRENSWKCARYGLVHDKDIDRCYKCGMSKKEALRADASDKNT